MIIESGSNGTYTIIFSEREFGWFPNKQTKEMAKKWGLKVFTLVLPNREKVCFVV